MLFQKSGDFTSGLSVFVVFVFLFLFMFDFPFYVAGPRDGAEWHMGRRRFIIELGPAGHAAISQKDDIRPASRDCILLHRVRTLTAENKRVCSFNPGHDFI